MAAQWLSLISFSPWNWELSRSVAVWTSALCVSIQDRPWLTSWIIEPTNTCTHDHIRPCLSHAALLQTILKSCICHRRGISLWQQWCTKLLGPIAWFQTGTLQTQGLHNYTFQHVSRKLTTLLVIALHIAFAFGKTVQLPEDVHLFPIIKSMKMHSYNWSPLSCLQVEIFFSVQAETWVCSLEIVLW